MNAGGSGLRWISVIPISSGDWSQVLGQTATPQPASTSKNARWTWPQITRRTCGLIVSSSARPARSASGSPISSKAGNEVGTGGWWIASRLVWRHVEAAAALGAALTAATIVVALSVLVPPVASVTSAQDLAQAVNRWGRFPPELWMVEQRSGSLVFYLDPALRRDLTRERVLQLSSPQVPEHEPVPGTRVAITVGDSPHLERYVRLDGRPYEPAGHYRMYDGERLLHAPHHRVPPGQQ